MLYFGRIGISKGVDVATECVICHYWFFNLGLEFQSHLCNGCHDLTLLCLNLSDVAIITVKGVDYCCITYNVSKSV